MIATYCGRHTAVQAVQWQPTEQSLLAKIISWGAQVKPDGTSLLLATPDPELIERVKPGDYIVQLDRDSFYRFTPREFKEHYARVEDQGM